MSDRSLLFQLERFLDGIRSDLRGPYGFANHFHEYVSAKQAELKQILIKENHQDSQGGRDVWTEATQFGIALGGFLLLQKPVNLIVVFPKLQADVMRFRRFIDANKGRLKL